MSPAGQVAPGVMPDTIGFRPAPRSLLTIGWEVSEALEARRRLASCLLYRSGQCPRRPSWNGPRSLGATASPAAMPSSSETL